MAGGNPWTGGWCIIRNIFNLHFREEGTCDLKGIAETKTLLSFGEPESKTATFFLKGVGGVITATLCGVVMVRAGSITGVSARFNLTSVGGSVIVEIRVLRDGVNVFNVEGSYASTGWQTLRLTQDKDIDTFTADQRITLQFAFTGGSGTVENTLAVAELTF